MSPRPSYLRVFLTFARNSLIRDMTFRGNFLINMVSSMTWVFMNLGFYVLIFEYSPRHGLGDGWGKYQFFLFLSTMLMTNSLVQTFFMRNADEFSELIRTGGLDFALVKPIDTQFFVSLQRVEWSSMGNFVLGFFLMGYSLHRVEYTPGPIQIVLYPVYVVCGMLILYSLMITLATCAVWLGRNQTLFNFWFYITNFSRYPMEIYRGSFGTPLRLFFTFIIPVLIVVNVPARLLAKPMNPGSLDDWLLPAFAVLATLGSLAASRWVFNRALVSYRSASS
ncbi:MAG: ABC transporter permease [Planctomycetota bacterium]|jgi:ABC-2 type transport system permease protein